MTPRWRQRLEERVAPTVPRGMTLVEIMIVIAVMASIMGIVGYSVFGAKITADKETARVEIQNLNGIVQSHYLTSSNDMPDSLGALTDGRDALVDSESDLRDPWGNRYVYEKKGSRDFVIYSAGPDGQKGTSDDVYADQDE